jgi:hypothetical protein
MPDYMLQIMGIKKLRMYKGDYDGRKVAVKRLIKPRQKKDKLRLAGMFGISLGCFYIMQSRKQH